MVWLAFSLTVHTNLYSTLTPAPICILKVFPKELNGMFGFPINRAHKFLWSILCCKILVMYIIIIYKLYAKLNFSQILSEASINRFLCYP